MKIYRETLSDVVRYVENQRHIILEDKEEDFQNLFYRIKTLKPINRKTKMLEIGIGTGWLPILCKKHGMSCKGIEISPQLIEYARHFGRKYGVEPDLELGNIEELDIGISKYDIIIARYTFEHVEHWQKGLKKAFDALKPGGLFYFSSTNKFSFTSDEYSFPLYGWLPDQLRYRLRIIRQREDIMKLGIDFNQFTPFQLRRFFKYLGFSIVLDKIESLDPDKLHNTKPWKKDVLKVLKQFRLLKILYLTFAPGTFFVCIK